MKRFVIAAAAAAMLAGPAVAGVGGFGNWLVSSADDGSDRVSASTTSTAGARLAVGCAHGQTVVFVAYPEPLTIEAKLPVRWRLDAGAVQAATWAVDEDRSSFVLDPAFFGRLAGGQRFSIDTGKRLDVFELDGIRRVAGLMQPCRAAAAG